MVKTVHARKYTPPELSPLYIIFLTFKNEHAYTGAHYNMCMNNKTVIVYILGGLGRRKASQTLILSNIALNPSSKPKR